MHYPKTLFSHLLLFSAESDNLTRRPNTRVSITKALWQKKISNECSHDRMDNSFFMQIPSIKFIARFSIFTVSLALLFFKAECMNDILTFYLFCKTENWYFATQVIIYFFPIIVQGIHSKLLWQCISHLHELWLRRSTFCPRKQKGKMKEKMMQDCSFLWHQWHFKLMYVTNAMFLWKQ